MYTVDEEIKRPGAGRFERGESLAHNSDDYLSDSREICHRNVFVPASVYRPRSRFVHLEYGQPSSRGDLPRGFRFSRHASDPLPPRCGVLVWQPPLFTLPLRLRDTHDSVNYTFIDNLFVGLPRPHTRRTPTCRIDSISPHDQITLASFSNETRKKKKEKKTFENCPTIFYLLSIQLTVPPLRSLRSRSSFFSPFTFPFIANAIVRKKRRNQVESRLLRASAGNDYLRAKIRPSHRQKKKGRLFNELPLVSCLAKLLDTPPSCAVYLMGEQSGRFVSRLCVRIVNLVRNSPQRDRELSARRVCFIYIISSSRVRDIGKTRGLPREVLPALRFYSFVFRSRRGKIDRS